MVEIGDMQAGKAGEYLVCADLIVGGYIAYPSEQGLSYDVVVDVRGRLLRVQVKTTRGPKAVPQRKDYAPAYLFQVRKMGKGGHRAYTAADVDLFALVALDSHEIGYVGEKQAKQTMFFRLPDFEGLYHGDGNETRKNKILEMRNQGATFREIGEKLGVDGSQAHRISRGEEGGPFHGLYLRDLTFDKALEAL